MTRLKAVLAAALLPALAGFAAALGQAPFGLWPLTLFGLSVLCWHVAAAGTARAGAFRGWCAGVGYFAGSLFWIVEPFLVEPERDGWMAPFAIVFMAAGMALFWLGAGLAAGLGRGPAGRAAGFALGLAASDLARSYVLTGFPWALVGHVWIATPVAQLAAFAGPVGLSILTMVLAVLPWLGATGRGRAMCTVFAAMVLAGAWGAGTWRLSAPEQARVAPIRVRLVQPNATQALKWQPGMWQEFVGRQLRANAAPVERPLDLIVWPETSVPYLLADSGALFADAVAASGGVPMALGIQRDQGLLYFNSIAVLDGSGVVTAVYDKSHLVPFGEYVPFGEVLARFGVKAFAATEGFGYSAGIGEKLLDLGRAGRVLPLICYEAIFPQGLRGVEGRADWILQVTNDGWFGNVAGPYQHLAQARLRAIEQGLPFLRAANTGVSAVIDARGRVLKTLALNRQGFLDADVPAALAPTIYVRFGDWPATMLLSVLIVAMALRRRIVAS